MENNTLVLFILASASLTFFPGPDMMYVIATSIAQGWKKGFEVSMGLCSGLIIHTLVVVLGLGSLLQRIPQSIRFIELFGACYFLFLGFQLWKNALALKESRQETKGAKGLFITGFIMNLSNPKVSLFFISFFPGFLFSDHMSYKQQFLILGMLFFVQAVFVFTISSLVVDRLRKKIRVAINQVLWNKVQALVLLFIALILIYP